MKPRPARILIEVSKRPATANDKAKVLSEIREFVTNQEYKICLNQFIQVAKHMPLAFPKKEPIHVIHQRNATENHTRPCKVIKRRAKLPDVVADPHALDRVVNWSLSKMPLKFSRARL